MSRIGRRPIAVPGGVTVECRGRQVSVKGPKGTLAEELPEVVQVQVEGGQVRFQRKGEEKFAKAAHGLARAMVANMVTGVTEGFARELEIHGVGYRAEVAGRTLRLTLGFSHPVEMEIPQGLQVSVKENTRVRIEGVDRHRVGQFAADVRGLRPPEPYKGKGIRYTDERVRRKVGKAGAA
jgi:large subunit ribosomal protein L6